MNMPLLYRCLQAIDAWAKSGSVAGAERAQNIHDGMVAMYRQTKDPLIRPSTISYNTLVNAWGKLAEESSPAMAERILQEMLDWDDPDMKPDAMTFSTVMDSYARANSPIATMRAEELFQIMKQYGVNPNIFTYSALQNVHARSGRLDAPNRTLAILEEMLELYAHGDVFAKPTSVNYNSVLNAYSRTNIKRSALQADMMLEKMELPVSEGGYDVEPDRMSYALTILACARCPDESLGAKLAEQNLEKMERRAEMDAKKRAEISSAAPASVTLDVECFNVALTAISKSRSDDSVQRTMNILERMEAYSKAGIEGIRPNARSWNANLNSIARSQIPDAIPKAESILNHMFRLSEEGVPDVKPDAFSFAALLSAYQRSSDPSAAQGADDMVVRMEKLYEEGDLDEPPDVYHYTIVCATWAKSKDKIAPHRCINILSHMKERDSQGYKNVRPNVRTYNAVLDCLSRAQEEEKAEQLLYHMLALANSGDKGSKPDSFSFNSVINAFTRSRVKDAGKRAEMILERFLEYSEENPDEGPDTRSFTNIIAYYGKSKHMLDAPYRAEYILNRMIALFKSGMKQYSPNVFPFTVVMESYSHHNHPDAGECAERLLRQMKKLKNEYNATRLEINTGVINSVLSAWVASGDDNAPRRAESHLQDMIEAVDAGQEELRPNARTFGLVLNAWSKSISLDKADRALSVLNKMKRWYNEGRVLYPPGEYAYAQVINACAFCDHGNAEKAFKIAVDLFDEIIQSSTLEPSSTTYGWFIQACGRLDVGLSEKDHQIALAFKHCCKNGYLSDFVLHRLRHAASDELFYELMKQSISIPPQVEKHKDRLKQRISMKQLPSEWSRNRLKKRLQRNSSSSSSSGRSTKFKPKHTYDPRSTRRREERG